MSKGKILVRVKEGSMVYHGDIRRREGAEFYINDEKEFSEKHMEKVEGKKAEPKKEEPKPEAKKPSRKVI